MKKVTCIVMIVFLFFTVICFTACANEPITLLEFESTSDIELDGKYSDAIITVIAHPSRCITSGVTLVANKQGYVEIEKGNTSIVVGRDYYKIEFTVTPIYNGTIYLNAKDSVTGVYTADSIKVEISGLEEKPITDKDERDYLIGYGWTTQMVESFIDIRKQIGMSRLKEITNKSEDIARYDFINEDNDICNVIFEAENVMEVYDCKGERKLYPSNGNNIIYISDITTEMKLDLQTLAKKTVRAHLLSPSTADFPLFDWAFTLGTSTTNCVVVVSYVDVQNIFGVSIRQNFAINILCSADGEYTWSAMLLGDQYYYNESLFN